MRKTVFWLLWVFVLEAAPLAFASAITTLCPKVVLEHNGGMDGRDINGNPRSRFHVVGSSGETGCPVNNSIVDVQANFYGDIEGALEQLTVMTPEGHVLSKIQLTDTGSPKKFDTVKVESIIACSEKGTVGSGTPGLCCDGLQPAGAFDPDTCERLFGGYYCIACGDGTCEDGLENSCNCPGDCPQ